MSASDGLCVTCSENVARPDTDYCTECLSEQTENPAYSFGNPDFDRDFAKTGEA